MENYISECPIELIVFGREVDREEEAYICSKSESGSSSITIASIATSK
jgi:hypothetical protein